MAAVTELQQHPKAEQVFLEMKREHPSIALGTVYLPPCREQEKTILWRRSIMNANVSLLLNEQINKEFYSAYLYLDFANYYAAAYEVRDFRTMQMLDWFIKEQGEEEKNAADLITKMDLFGGDSKGLYMLNSELKARVYTAPSLVL